ncbi:MAG: PAS domain S-box protein [Polyangiaceae bacterium]|nr:PAS domain S-box protein [Polyangiaceae bacterium]
MSNPNHPPDRWLDSPVLLATLDASRCIVKTNAEWSVLGGSASELHGRSVSDLVAATEATRLAAALVACQVEGSTIELHLHHGERTPRRALCRFRSVADGGWEMAALLLGGPSGTPRVAGFVPLMTRAASRLPSLAPDALPAGLRSALEELCVLLGVDGAFVLTLADGGDALWRVADWAQPEIAIEVAEIERLSAPEVRALVATVTKRRACPSNRCDPDPAVLPMQRALCPEGSCSVLVLLLDSASGVRGLLGLVMANVDRSWQPEELELINAVAETAATSLERRSMETELLESEERSRNIIHESPMGMHVYELRPDGRLVLIEANPAAERITRRPVRQLTNAGIEEAFPGLEPAVLERFRLAAALGLPTHLPELTWSGASGDVTLELHLFQTSPGRVAVMFGDITDRKRTDEALRQSEQRLRAILEGAANVAFVITDADAESPHIVEFSPGAENTFGYRSEEILGQSLFTLLDQPEATALRVAYERMRQGHEGYSGEIMLRRRAGSRFPALYHTNALRDESGEMSFVLGVGLDVSEQRRLESFLQQAQKMEALGTLAGGIAHDFNNILGAVMGYTELALLALPRDSVVAGHLSEVLVAATRATELVRQILAFSRRSDEEVRPIQIGPIVREAMKMLRASIPRTIEIRPEVATELGCVVADPTRIHQVLMNLCTNAAHAMRENGGLLTVEIEDTDVAEPTTAIVPNCPPGAYVRLTVRDTGHGIAPTHLDRIFDPYFTTKAKGVGTGLGLAVVHGIVESYGGVIGVKSQLDEGTTFDILLPRLAEATAVQNKASSLLPRGTERILVIDDEEALVAPMVLSLGRLGYRATGETNPNTALEMVRATPDAFDLVITDQTMQHMTGDRLAREVHAVRPDLPIVICTGFSETLTEERALALGASALLEKPVSLNTLAWIVRAVLEGRLPTRRQ